MDVTGVGFPGSPGVILGQNQDITWGATTNPMDVTDVFSDTLYVGTAAVLLDRRAGLHREPARHVPRRRDPAGRHLLLQPGRGLRERQPGPGHRPAARGHHDRHGAVPELRPDHRHHESGRAGAAVRRHDGARAPVHRLPRHPGARDLRALEPRRKPRPSSRMGLEFFDVGSQNWAYADRAGNLAYFTSAEMPLRTDLEQGAVVGLPPFFVRDGMSGAEQLDRRPRATRRARRSRSRCCPRTRCRTRSIPENGFFVNANNDPAGTSLDNDPLNQVRVVERERDLLPEPGLCGRPARRTHHPARSRTSSPAAARDRATDMKEFQEQYAAARRRAAGAVPARGVRQRSARRTHRASSPRSRATGSRRRSGASSSGTSRRRRASRRARTRATWTATATRGSARRRDRRERGGDDLQHVARLRRAHDRRRAAVGLRPRRRLHRGAQGAPPPAPADPLYGRRRGRLRVDSRARRALGGAAARPRAARARWAMRSTSWPHPRSRRRSPNRPTRTTIAGASCTGSSSIT